MFKNKLAVIGIGYVGLPLAASLSKHNQVLGFDIDKKRIKELKDNIDITKEFSINQLDNLNNLKFSSNIADLKNANIFFITVPTPINIYKKPDLKYLIKATEIAAKNLEKN